MIASYPAVSLVHIGSAIAAIAAGAFVLLRVKGTRLHRRTGLAYACAMVVLNVTSFSIFSLTGEASAFHLMAAFSLLTVVIGFAAAALRWPRDGWLVLHLQFMVWSYIGLLAAAAAEAMVRIPGTRFWWAVAVASFAVMAAGGFLFYRRLPALHTRYAHFARRRP